MYEFVDTTEEPAAVTLPAEALSINGEYIENLIDGYQTLNTSGRETVITELSETEIGLQDGEYLSGRRYAAREITVTFQLVADNARDFREKFNALNSILNVENAELIFNDENDKYLVGTPSAASEIDAGRNAVVGEFTIKCHDPYKYSLQEYEVNETEDENGKYLIVDYDGDYPTSPKIVTEFKKSDTADDMDGVCGYVGFADKDGHVLQFGKLTEPDDVTTEVEKIIAGTATRTKSQPLMQETFDTQSWRVNRGINSGGYPQVGSAKAALITSGATNKALQANSYGSTSNKQWHGPAVSKKLPNPPNDPLNDPDHAPAEGTRSEDFDFSLRVRFAAHSNTNTAKKQAGLFEVYICGPDLYDLGVGIPIAGVRLQKSKGGTTGTIKAFVMNQDTMKTWKNVDFSHYNKYFGYKKKSTDKRSLTIRIARKGTKISFNIGGYTYSASSSALTGELAEYVSYYFGQWQATPVISSNGVYDCNFSDTAVEYTDQTQTIDYLSTIVDLDNIFNTNDVLTVDCADASVRLKSDNAEDVGEEEIDGGLRPDLGALGNDWEAFKLQKGTNIIACGYSDFCKTAPTFTLKYRKKYL